MKTTDYWMINLLGLTAALIVIVFTIGLLITTYQISQSPPPFLTQGTRPEIVDISFIIAGLIQASVGGYLTRNIYLWSKTQ